MLIGYFGGTVNDGTLDDCVDEARQAEADGFASYWAPNIFGHDALTTLAIIGREVPRIGLGTSVVPTYPRHPMAIAQQSLTVNAACGGRLTLGIGLSHRVVIENMMGMSYDKPIRHIRDYLSILGPLSRGETARHKGEDYTAFGGISAKGAPPFDTVVAALGPQMLKATAELAAGTITWCTGPATLGDYIVPTINAAAEAADRPAPRVVAALPVCVTDDFEGVKARAAKVFEVYGTLPSYRAMLDREGAAGPEDVAIVGSEAEVVERIAALADRGVTEFAAVEFPGNADEAAATRAAMKTLIGQSA
ncbi:MAG: LLM class F420-dependent oxidoreductase [Ilumatobacter sp.]|nr:LLM class F420-dependent oxidoreductase [Ilumatobacter sp.]